MLGASVSSLMISLTLMDKAYHTPFPVIALILVVAILLVVLFIRRCKSSQNAVISMELLARRPFMAANIYNFAYGACAQGGVMSLMPLYATSVYNMSVFESGLMITPRSFGMMVASIVTSFYLLKWGYRRPIIMGTMGIVLGLVLLALEPGTMTFAGINLTPAMLVMLCALIVGTGAGLAAPACNNACLELLPDKVASIAGLRQIARQTGGAIGIAVSTLVLESSASMAQGFTIVFMGLGLMLLLSLPAVFFMPKGPTG